MAVLGERPMTDHNPFHIAQRQLDEAARILKLDPAIHEDFLSKVVVATSADGSAAVLAGGELEPRFMDGAAILATTREGAALSADEGGVRLIVPWDRKPGRWAKRIVSLELREG